MPKISGSERLFIDGPAGRLEAVYERPVDTSPLGCAVICHPHPLYGGSMSNKVAHTLARSFLRVGCSALRFNFRGVGLSAGEYDDGDGELGDALAAMDWLRSQDPGVPVWSSGFSFGAAIAIRVAVTAAVDGLISVAPAVSRFASGLPSQPDCPWLVLQGDQDELVDVDETVAWINGLEPGPELQIVSGAEHFFHGRLHDLRAAVTEFIESTRT